MGECAGGRLWECALRACAERVTQPAEELVELLRRPGRGREHVGAGGRVPARVAASLAGRVGLVAEGLVLDVPQQPLDAEELRDRLPWRGPVNGPLLLDVDRSNKERHTDLVAGQEQA